MKNIQQKRLLPVTAIVASTMLVLGSGVQVYAASDQTVAPPGDLVRVNRVIDGSTFQTTINGVPVTVKYIGLATPAAGQCYSQQAKSANAKLIAGQKVTLVGDTTNTDSKGDLLRYVYLPNGDMVNADLLAKGIAQVQTASPNVKFEDSLNAAAKQASAARLGGWSACNWQSSTTSAAPISLSMAQLNQRVAELPQFASLKNGDPVTIYDDGSVTGSVWQGTYIWHPAGSKVQPDNMYARWKDGLVTITRATDITGTLYAGFLEQDYATEFRSYIANDPGIVVPVSEHQTIKPLISEPSVSGVLRIPNNAFLFRVDPNGQYTALVDVFEFQSGSQPVPVNTPPGTVPTPSGTQPVPVMHNN